MEKGTQLTAQLSVGKKVVLGLQHVLAMFGATVLVPLLTGLDPSIAILGAGIGTLIFHAVTKGKVPVFLGSSFAFITAITLTLDGSGIGAVKTGIIAAGLIYVLVAGLIKLFGVQRVHSLFPPIVTGPIIIVIGLRLSPSAIENAFFHTVDGASVFYWQGAIVAMVVLITMIIVSIFAKGFFQLVPILISVIVGYLLALAMGMVNTAEIAAAPWIGLSAEGIQYLKAAPEISWSGILAIAPIALVVFVEHIGDITTNGAVVGQDFFQDPGIHRTMLGDGLATIVAGLIGAPANTTYSENTGVLAVTKVYDPSIIRIAAVFAIVLSMFGKFGAFVRTIPGPVMGGISIVLFGMIASVGLRILINAKLDFSHSRNLLIAAVILVMGIGIDNLPIYGDITISGLAIAAIAGVIMNKVLPEEI
ncbi:uracil-xanthine permease family protein [Bianquea renquensis]|jgi:uracil-xanthine permease|uniref:Uracil-xanthine permease n=1 Tax=Bianquea renquensis TaxID=2763661 RepID=A0A926DTF7_9FIRM|nr:uracil-xanthine permease family protein [Bianquea renquensis]MBC8542970.1 uracil-xanthine permease [Bianquea renquensis]